MRVIKDLLLLEQNTIAVVEGAVFLGPGVTAVSSKPAESYDHHKHYELLRPMLPRLMWRGADAVR